MDDNSSPANIPETVGQALQYCSDTLLASDVFFGHGTDNAWDEAVQMVLAIAELPLDAGDGVLPHPLDHQAFARLQELLRQRIEELRDRLAEHTFGVEEPCEERPVKSAGLQPSERVRPRMRGAF